MCLERKINDPFSRWALFSLTLTSQSNDWKLYKFQGHCQLGIATGRESCFWPDLSHPGFRVSCPRRPTKISQTPPRAAQTPTIRLPTWLPEFRLPSRPYKPGTSSRPSFRLHCKRHGRTNWLPWPWNKQQLQVDWPLTLILYFNFISIYDWYFVDVRHLDYMIWICPWIRDYKNLLDYFHTCDVTSAVAASSGNSASTAGGSVASGSGRAMGAPASNSTPLGLPPMPQNFPPTEIQALLSKIDI